MLRQKLNKIALGTLLTLLAGCATPVVVSSCPPLKSYSREFNDALADAVLRAPQVIVDAISDYYVLRRQVAACAGRAGEK